MTTQLKDMVVILICDDTQESIRFYETVLSFTVVNRMNDVGKTGWASLNHGSIQLMLASPSDIAEPRKSDGRYSQSIYYFYPDNVEQLHADVRAKGYSTTDLVVRFYGMKEFEMLDPSGHVLVFGQESDEPPTPEKS